MFNFSFDKKTMYILIAAMAAIVILQYAREPGQLQALLLTAPGVLIAITFHEFAHGITAYWLGDNTAKSQGRLSLNPFKHLDPIGTMLLLVAGFGWGKPVEVEPRNYTRKMSMETGQAIVSVAGPVMNFILAIIFTLIYCAIWKYAYFTFVITEAGSIVMSIIGYTITVNIGLGIFNLIPLPPLDGSKIITPFLPYKAKQFFMNNEQIFYIIFIVIWISGVAGSIISPAIRGMTDGVINLGKMIFGL